MGQVFEARHLFLDRAVAIKILSGGVGRSPASAERFIREARTLSRIQHPNVVRIFDSGRTAGGLFYIAMELLHGTDLRQHCASFEGPLPWAHACDVLVQLLAGVAAVHAEGVLHRDLKPANTFLARDADGITVKLIDFGVAKPAMLGDHPGLTRDGALIGTPDYIAPELLRGAGPATPQSDLYALGVIAYQMLTGHLPFSGDSMLERMNAAVGQQPAPLHDTVPELPAAIAAVIGDLLAKDPNDRPTSAEAARAQLRAAMSLDDGITPHSGELDDAGAPTLDLRHTPLPTEDIVDGPSRAGPWKGVVVSLLAVAAFVGVVDRLASAGPEPTTLHARVAAAQLVPLQVMAPTDTAPTDTAPADTAPTATVATATARTATARTATAPTASTPPDPRAAATATAPAATAATATASTATTRADTAHKDTAHKDTASPVDKRPRPSVAPTRKPPSTTTPNDATLLRRLRKRIARRCKDTPPTNVSFLIGSNGKALGVTARPAGAGAACARTQVTTTSFRPRTATTPIRLEVPTP